MTYLQSQGHYSIYEPYLATIAANWPTPTVFSPSEGKALSTLEVRIRIILGVLDTNPEWRTFTCTNWPELRKELYLSRCKEPGKLWCGPRSDRCNKVHSRTVVGCADDMPLPALEKLLAFCATGYAAPITLTTTHNLPAIAAQYDVIVESLGNNKYSIT